ncbi:MAG: hypothetical protein IJ735_05875 [Clostridia bacterium]|nr:hypothetical protein [Clostridia bacterium]
MEEEKAVVSTEEARTDLPVFEKSSVSADLKVNRELTRRAFKNYFVFMIAGLIGLGAGIAFGILLGFAEMSVVVILVACSLLVVMDCGLIVYLLVQTKKNAEQKIVVEAEFFEEYLYSTSYKNGEKNGEQKTYYREFLCYKTSQEYVYLFPNKFSAVPVKKSADILAFLDAKGVKKKRL